MAPSDLFIHRSGQMLNAELTTTLLLNRSDRFFAARLCLAEKDWGRVGPCCSMSMKSLCASDPRSGPGLEREFPQAEWNRVSAFFRTGASISLIRVAAVGCGAIGSVWDCPQPRARKAGDFRNGCRCPGPSRGLFVVEMQQQSILVRDYKAAGNGLAKEELLQCVQSFRTIAGIAMLLILGGIWFFVRPPGATIAILALAPLLLARLMTPAWIFQAEESMVPASFLALGQQVLTVSAYLLLIRRTSPAGSDLWCQAAAAVLLGVVTWGFVRKKFLPRSSAWLWSSITRMWRLAWRGRWLFLAGAAAYAYGALEGPLIGYMVSVPDLGKYRTAQSLASLADLVAFPVPMILFPRFIEWRKKGFEFLWARQLRIAKAMLLLLIPMAALSWLIVPKLHELIFGAIYKQAALPATILIISKLVVMVNGVFAWGMVADGGQDRRTALLMSSVAVISVTLNLALLPHLGMLGAACVNLSSESLILIGAFWMCHNHANRKRAMNP